MPETKFPTLPNAPKIPLARYMRVAKDNTAVAPATVVAPEAIKVAHPETVALDHDTDLDDWLQADPQAVTTVEIPADYNDTTPIRIDGSKLGGGLLKITVGANAHVALQERWVSAGANVGIAVQLDAEEGAQVDWLSYDAFSADVVLLQRTANLAKDAKLNWTVAGFTHNSGASILTTNLNGNGSEATVNVGVLASGKQHIGYATAITNYAEKTVGHINQRGVIVDKAHLVFNGVGHIVQGARGSDSQQENRVLMLSEAARGDANPILLIDENDVTAGHAASVSRVDANQMYYLMSRGVPEHVAKRLVIRGFLEAGLSEIEDPDLRDELFATIDETLVNADA
ncbi:SufD family Fe-S cluster assembly protein [Lacticaseibacillus sp. GG6-2]